VWNHFFPPGEQIKDSVLLDHFWTLSLEEQFYIMWPGCLVLLGRRWSAILAMIGVVAFPLLRFCVFRYWGSEYPGTQGNILVRMMQDLILIGTLAAFVARSRWLERLRTTPARHAFPLISLLVLFVVCPWIGSQEGLGMDTYLVPTLQGVATVLFMFWLLTGSGGPIRSVLEWAPVVRLGLISYSLYILQQAITYWEPAAWIKFPWNALMTIPLALACYTYWEMPMRAQIRKWFHLAGTLHG
jgi:peptidoglycan/LPS O-acetylase OafA/YrhL